MKTPRISINNTRIVTPKEFIEILERLSPIEPIQSEIVPPHLGKRDFGKIKIRTTLVPDDRRETIWSKFI